MSRIVSVTLLALLGIVATESRGRCYDLLPYSTRTHGYSGWSSTVWGDIRTVGMAGANVGLADTFIGTSDTPAGLALTLNGADANITTNWTHDGYVQNFANATSTTDVGVASNIYPWGVGLGYVAPYSEGQLYDPGVLYQVSVRELRFSLARVLFGDHLSLGASLIAGQAGRDSGSVPDVTYALGAAFSAMYRFPSRFILGVNYSLPMHYGVDTAGPAPTLPGFFQPVEVPSRIGVGVGWIPNRFFKADFSLYWVGTTPNTALVRDDSVIVGAFPTIQPRLGASYVFADYKELKAIVSAGTYLEQTRIEGTPLRLHGTAGIEAMPWILIFGAGIDVSYTYQNYIALFGVDVLKLFRKMDVVPPEWHPPHAGFFPRPTHLSDVGLARPLVAHWRPHGPNYDPLKVGLAIPKKLEQKVKQTGTGVLKAIESIPKAIGKGLKRPKGRHRPKKRRKKPTSQASSDSP